MNKQFVYMVFLFVMAVCIVFGCEDVQNDEDINISGSDSQYIDEIKKNNDDARSVLISRTGILVIIIDTPALGSSISGSSISVSGWAICDNGSSDSGVNRVDVYLDGPYDSSGSYGKYIGTTSYGLYRPDVANYLGNVKYAYSGFSLTFQWNTSLMGDIEGLHTFYFYARNSVSNQFAMSNYVTRSVNKSIVAWQTIGGYVCAENAGQGQLIANRYNVGLWEKFELIRVRSSAQKYRPEKNGYYSSIALKALINDKYVCADYNQRYSPYQTMYAYAPLYANRNSIGPWETFTLSTTNYGSGFYAALISYSDLAQTSYVTSKYHKLSPSGITVESAGPMHLTPHESEAFLFRYQ